MQIQQRVPRSDGESDRAARAAQRSDDDIEWLHIRKTFAGKRNQLIDLLVRDNGCVADPHHRDVQSIQWHRIDPADRQRPLAVGSEFDQVGVIEGQIPVVARTTWRPLLHRPMVAKELDLREGVPIVRAIASGSDVESGSSRGNGPLDVMTGCLPLHVELLVGKFTDWRPDAAPMRASIRPRGSHPSRRCHSQLIQPEFEGSGSQLAQGNSV